MDESRPITGLAGLAIGVTSPLHHQHASSFALAQKAQEEIVNDEDIIVASLTEMEYPSFARLAPHTEGVVVVRVRVDDEGKVISSQAISGPKTLLEACLANAMKWRFHPNSKKLAVIIYEFRIDGFCSKGSHFTFRQPNFAAVTGCRFGESTSPGISPN
jgi:hypothetical protein